MCFMFVNSSNVCETPFHELTMRYFIFMTINLSKVIPSFLWFRGMKILKERIQLVRMQHINLFKNKINVGL
jgi:hypothetical protein